MEYARAVKFSREHGTPLLLLFPGILRERYRSLRSALPGVDLYYAVKSNPAPELLAVLQEEGAFFDVSTGGEVEAVAARGITADRCLHSHPVKTAGQIEAALRFGMTLFTVDNEFELNKFVPFRGDVQLLVRISIQNPSAQVNLSHKFGVNPTRAFALIRKARKLGLTVAGLSFHAGSQNENPLKFIEALEYCRDICRKAAVSGTALSIINIGGGFPIDYLREVPAIGPFCRPIVEYLERFFAGYRVVAEPGRYLSGPAVTLAAKVIGKARREGVRWYYLDEGLYGSFSGKVFDHARYPFTVPRRGTAYNSTLAGPTCDSFDIVHENIPLPELEIGDIILFGSMGAYTSASASTFNGFAKARLIAVD